MENVRDYGRIGRFIYGFHRIASPDELRALSGVPLPALLAERGAALAGRFDALLADWHEDSRLERADSVTDERMATLLADVQAFAAELAYARNQ